MFQAFLDFFNWALVFMMGVSVILLLYKIVYHIYGLFPQKQYPEAKKQHKFAILIPARNESSVIEGLLKSLNEQDYPKELFDSYVIVESSNDPTVKICEKYENVTAFVRPNLNVKSKGGALDQILKHLIETKKAFEYEAYFIFDADNVAKSNFLTEMNKTFDCGFEMGLSYRNAKNWNDGWIASCSALTFIMFNTFQNKCRAKFNKNVLVSGTGFYIAAHVLHELGGWPFQTLTEDFELSNYAVLNNIKGAYNENTEFFDEQPKTLKISWNQRVRWCKGHMQVSKKYQKKLLKSSLVSTENRLGKLEYGLNILPIATPIATVIVYSLITLIMGIVGIIIKVGKPLWQLALFNSATALLVTYIFFVCYTAALLFCERKHINITLKNSIKTSFLNPIFMVLYLPIYITALFKKEVKWKPITRSVDLNKETKPREYSELILDGEQTDMPTNEDVSKDLDAEFVSK